MDRERDQGAITVFLAVTFIFIMAMLGTLIDGARLVEAHSQVYYAADLAANSALAEFNYRLKDQYGLFAYEDDPKQTIEQVVKQNLSQWTQDASSSEELYNSVYDSILEAIGVEDPLRKPPFDLLQMNDIQISQGTPITLANQNEMERQIFEYVKFRGPIELFTNHLSFDFEEMSQELDYVRNEDSVDKAMQSLQEQLAKFMEDEGKYNQLVKEFQEKMKEIQEDKYQPIRQKLENESGSISGLGEIKDKISTLSGALSLAAECDKRIEALEALKKSQKELTEAIEKMEKRFSKQSNTFDGKAISSEMMDNYQQDLENMRQDGSFHWSSGSNLDKEIQKYKAIKTTSAHLRGTLFPQYREEISDLEEREEDSEDRDESLSEEIDDLWDKLQGHFQGSFYNGNSAGIFKNSENLNQLEASRAVDLGQESKKDEWAQAAEEADKQENKREYTKEIPSDYSLPSELSPEEVAQNLGISLDNDFDVDSIEEAKEKREGNQQSVDSTKDLFQGVGSLTLNTFDNAMLGIYALGNFQNALCYQQEWPANYGHSKEDTSTYQLNMRNDEIDQIFFDDCEVEYLILGNPEEQKNYLGIRNELTGLYFILNYGFVRRPDEIKAIVEGVAQAAKYAASAVAGALTLGAGAGVGVIVYYAVREACYASLAAIQTSHDLQRLYFGNKAPLLKKDVGDFCGITSLLGLQQVCVSDDSKIKASKLPIGYTDYLFLRMVITGQKNLKSRLQNLIEINMNTSGGTLDTSRPFKMENARTSATVTVQANMPFFFINVMFMADQFQDQGMIVKKSASQKY